MTTKRKKKTTRKKTGPKEGAPAARRMTPAQRRKLKDLFLDSLRRTCNVTVSAREVGMTRRGVYTWRDGDEEFAAEWEDAIEEAVDLLENEARRRAMLGVEKPIMYKGEEVAVVREYSDRLMEVLLMAHRPEKYKRRFSGELSGPAGGPIRTITTDMSAKEAAEAYAASLDADD